MEKQIAPKEEEKRSAPFASEGEVIEALKLPERFAEWKSVDYRRSKDKDTYLFTVLTKKGETCMMKAVAFNSASRWLLTNLDREFNVGQTVSLVTPHSIKMLEMQEILLENPPRTLVGLLMEHGGKNVDALRETMTKEEALGLGYQLVCGLEAIEDLGVAHTDLKLENMVVGDGKDSSMLKLIDYGTSLAFYMEPARIKEEPIGEECKRLSGATIEFTSPEAIAMLTDPNKAKDVIPQKIDAFCFAMCIVKMLRYACDHKEYKFARVRVSNDKLVEEINQFLKEEAKMDEGWADVITRCLSKNLRDRPTFAQLKQIYEELLIQEERVGIIEREINRTSTFDHYKMIKECEKSECPAAIIYHCRKLIENPVLEPAKVAEAKYYIGKAWFHLNDLNNAAKYLNECIELQNTLSTEPLFPMIKAYNALGSAYIGIDDFKNALDKCDIALAMAQGLYADNSPEMIYIYYNHMLIYMTKFDFKEIESYADKIIGIIKQRSDLDQASLATIYSIMAVVGKALHYENAMDLLSKASNLVKEKYGDSAMENLSIYEAILQISRLEPCILAFAGSSRSAIDMKKLIINAHADTPQAISKKRARLVHFSSFFALYNVAFGNFEEICGSQYTEEPFSEFQTMGLICGYFILADLCASHWLTETAHYYHDEVLKCTRRIRGEDDQALPTECLSIGLLYLKERNWTSAAESLEKALKKSKKSKNSKMTLLILGQLAFAYESIGMHDKKILCMEEIERIKRADSSFNERIIIQSHIDSMLNGSIETLKWMKHMLVIRLGKGTPILANIYVAFMNFYFRAGDLRACLWYINKALGLAFRNKIPETDMKILEIYSLLAPVYDKLCESEKAITWYEFIIAHYEKLPYKNRELCDEWTHALEYIRRKERILIDELAVLEARPDSAKTAGNRYEIAEDYFSLGYYSKAVAPFEWCIENLRVNEKPEIIFALAEIHYKLGITYTALGDSTKALSHLKDGAIPLLANIDKNVEQVRAYWAVAEIYEKSDPEQARAYRRLAKSLSSQMQQKLGMCNAC